MFSRIRPLMPFVLVAAVYPVRASAEPGPLADVAPPVAAVAGPAAGEAASVGEDEPDMRPAKKRFREQVEVVAEQADDARAPAELPVRPVDVMAVAGSADNVFRTLQTLPGVAATTEFDSRLSVRGGSPDENLTVMDGVEIHNPYRLFGLTSAFNPETVSAFSLYAGAFSAAHGDRLSSLLVVENRAGTSREAFAGSTAISLTDANGVFEGKLPGGARGSWIFSARRTYYDLAANSLVGTELPAFGDLQGRVDWQLEPGTTLSFFGLRSREATDAAFEGDREGEQGSFVTKARNDLAALSLKTLLGTRGVSRTIASWYENADAIGADALFRADSRRSNAPSDEIGFRLADIAFTRDLELRDLALRQELSLELGGHLVDVGFEMHDLRTSTAWRIEGDRNPSAANGSSVQGGAGLPDALDSTVDGTRGGLWLQDRFGAAKDLALEAGLRLDWSGVNRRATLSPRLAASWRLGERTRLRAGAGLFSQSPGYEKLIQSDYFVDLSGELGRSLRHERAAHAVLGLERDLGGGVSGRVEGYWKGFSDLIVGRLESEAERAARVARYDFPAELASSIPAEAIVTSYPVNAATGRSWGVDALLQRKPVAGARLSGWASYAYGVSQRDEYGRLAPFDYDRRHAVTLVGTWRLGARWELAATMRAFSGFARTPVVALRVAADETSEGRLVPALDTEGRYVYETDLGGALNLNTSRLPAFFRLDLRLSWKPRGDAGRWQLYLDVINATNRNNAGQIDSTLAYDPASDLDQPRLVEQRAASLPFLPSFGVRFRF